MRHEREENGKNYNFAVRTTYVHFKMAMHTTSVVSHLADHVCNRASVHICACADVVNSSVDKLLAINFTLITFNSNVLLKIDSVAMITSLHHRISSSTLENNSKGTKSNKPQAEAPRTVEWSVVNDEPFECSHNFIEINN